MKRGFILITELLILLALCYFCSYNSKKRYDFVVEKEKAFHADSSAHLFLLEYITTNSDSISDINIIYHYQFFNKTFFEISLQTSPDSGTIKPQIPYLIKVKEKNDMAKYISDTATFHKVILTMIQNDFFLLSRYPKVEKVCMAYDNSIFSNLCCQIIYSNKHIDSFPKYRVLKSNFKNIEKINWAYPLNAHWIIAGNSCFD